MSKFNCALLIVVVIFTSTSFDIGKKKIIYLENIEVDVEDPSFKLQNVMIIKGQDSSMVDLTKTQKPIKIDITKNLKLVLFGENDTLEINDLIETFEENEYFSLRITVPVDYDYCYYLAYFENYGEEYAFYKAMAKDSTMNIDQSKKCIDVYVDSNYK